MIDTPTPDNDMLSIMRAALAGSAVTRLANANSGAPTTTFTFPSPPLSDDSGFHISVTPQEFAVRCGPQMSAKEVSEVERYVEALLEEHNRRKLQDIVALIKAQFLKDLDQTKEDART